MNLTIDLNPEAESRLKTAAKRRGVRPEVFAKQIIEEHLPIIETGGTDQATLDLLARWDVEDATTDPKEIASLTSKFVKEKTHCGDDECETYRQIPGCSGMAKYLIAQDHVNSMADNRQS